MYDRDGIFILATLFDFSIMLVASIASAQPTDSSGICGAATVQLDNDEMGGTDRHYTGGIRLACVRSPPHFLRDVVLPKPSPGAITHSRSTYSIGQSIFTPDDLSRSEPIEDDQPYAGWLYLGFSLESEVIPKADSLRYLDNVELQLGVIGPLSGAEQVQRATHGILGATDPQGWDNQLDNEPGINLFYSRQWTGAKEVALTDSERLPKLFLDITPKLGAALGNVHTFGAAGLTFRLGSFQPDDHGPPVIRPSLPGSDYFPRQDRWSAYLFGGVEALLQKSLRGWVSPRF